MRYIFLSLLTLCCTVNSHGQESRTTDDNSIGWIGFFGTFKTGKSISIHTEYQYRRVNGLSAPMQHLLRTGVNFQILDGIILHAGYGYIKTYPYGEYPIASAGVPFPEHRSYQQIQIKNSFGKSAFSHRFRLEQRWLGKINASDPDKIEKWNYLNRARYLIRFSTPLVSKGNKQGKLYGVLQNEIFIGFGNNIGANVFDQNRLGILAGIKVNQNLNMEIGYLYQILLQGSRINQNSIFQHNRGYQLSLFYTADLRRQIND